MLNEYKHLREEKEEEKRRLRVIINLEPSHYILVFCRLVGERGSYEHKYHYTISPLYLL
jgi:hypothetical protein